jgi:hypothetical protein
VYILLREEPTGEDEVDLTTCLMKPLGIDLLHGKRGLDAVRPRTDRSARAHSMARLAA